MIQWYVSVVFIQIWVVETHCHILYVGSELADFRKLLTVDLKPRENTNKDNPQFSTSQSSQSINQQTQTAPLQLKKLPKDRHILMCELVQYRQCDHINEHCRPSFHHPLYLQLLLPIPRHNLLNTHLQYLSRDNRNNPIQNRALLGSPAYILEAAASIGQACDFKTGLHIFVACIYLRGLHKPGISLGWPA